MLSLSRTAQPWSTWPEFDQLRDELSKAFTTIRGPQAQSNDQLPAINIWKRNDGGLTLTAELPGVEVEDIEVCVDRDTVVLRVGGPVGAAEDGQNYLRKERHSRSIERAVQLPFEVNQEAAEATYEKGILTLTLQQPPEHKPKRVAVKSR